MLSEYISSENKRQDFYDNVNQLKDQSYLLKKVRGGETTFKEIGQPFIDKSIKVEQDFYDSNNIFSSRKDIIGKDDRDDLGFLAQQLYQEDIIDVRDFFYSRIKLRKRNAAHSRGWGDGPGRDALAGFATGMSGMAFIPLGDSLGGALGVAGVSAALGIGAYRSLNLVQNSLCTSFESDRNYFGQALEKFDTWINEQEAYEHEVKKELMFELMLRSFLDK